MGEWEPLLDDADPLADWHKGSMKIRLKGERLEGGFALVRMHGGKYGDNDEKRSWLLIKERDEYASEQSVAEEFTSSVTTGRSMEEIAEGSAAKGSKNRGTAGGLRVWSGTKDAKEQAAPADPSTVDGAKKSAFPASIKPQLATLVQSAPDAKNWVHEIKFDGYRFLAFLKHGKVTMMTRNGKDWTEKFQQIAEEIARLPVESAVIDGELVALDEKGVSRFQLLQNSLDGTANPALAFYAFDLVYLNGYSLKKATLQDRKELLRQVMAAFGQSDIIRFSEHFTEPGDDVWQQACRMGLEGIISKDLLASYEEKRSKSWVKVKCSARQEFVIGGYTDPSGARQGFGALLVGYHNGAGELIYAGKVGTGFSDAGLRDLTRQMEALSRKTSPFKNPPREGWARRVHWIEPELVGEIAYTEMTDEGMLRHPSFQGLREDKKAKDVVMEEPKSTASTVKAAGAEIKREKAAAAADKAKAVKSGGKGETAKKKPSAKTATPSSKTKSPAKNSAQSSSSEYALSNPDKVLFPDEGYTKRDLADYYSAVEDRAFPWLVNRPITLVRCPAGRTKPCFYQRHNKTWEMPGIKPVDIDVKGGTETYIYMAEPEGLHTLVQQSTLEIHGWQCRADDVDHPDRMIFDIDPSPEVEWAQVVAAAKTVKALLEKCGFVTFPMTTGGKGLHVVAPLKPRAGWDEVITFAEAIARFLETSEPDRFTANLSKKRRVGRVFVDYLRNHKTASAILPYSSRARAGATVATPVTWRDVTAKLDPSKFTIKTVPGRIARQKNDPWQDYESSRRELVLEEVIKHLQSR